MLIATETKNDINHFLDFSSPNVKPINTIMTMQEIMIRNANKYSISLNQKFSITFLITFLPNLRNRIIKESNGKNMTISIKTPPRTFLNY